MTVSSLPEKTNVPSDGDDPRGVDRRLVREIGAARRALLVSVLVGLVTTACVVAQVILLAHLIGWAMAPRHHAIPVALVTGFGVAVAVRGLLGGLGEALAARSGVAVTSRLRRDLLEAAVAGGPSWLAPQRTGSIALLATRGLRSLEPFFSRYLPAAVVAAVAPAVALAVLVLTDWPSALVAVGLVAIIPVAMIRLGRRAQAASDRQWSRLSSLSGRTLELLRGLPTLRALGRVDRGREELAAASRSVAESVDATLGAALSSGAVLEFIAGVGVGLVAMLAGLRLLDGSLTIVPALAVILITPEVFLPLRRAGAEFHASTEGRAAALSVFTMIDDAPIRGDDRHETPASPFPVILHRAQALLSNHRETSIPPFELSVAPTDHVVVSGPSGSGKSTLLSLLCGFVSPASGEVTLGGSPASEVDPAWLSRHVALVPQRPHIFATSLRENVALGREASDDLIASALREVGLDHLLDVSSEDPLSRILAEDGRSVSAGERQRIGLARAIVADPALLLLDEATAHLDDETESALRERLGPWLASRAVVEVGHRQGLVSAPTRRISLGEVTVR